MTIHTIHTMNICVIRMILLVAGYVMDGKHGKQ